MCQYFKERINILLDSLSNNSVANITHGATVLQIFLPVCVNKLSGKLSTGLPTR
jgi:hypothetical protein